MRNSPLSIKLAAAIAMLSISSFSFAGFRIQHYTPELRWMAQPEPEKSKVEAAIVAPRGLTCYLPSADGFCTIPLIWLTNQDDPASLWREMDGARIKVASGYDGQVNAYVRLNKTPRYEIIQGAQDSGKLLDAATLSAIYDPTGALAAASKQGDISLANNGDCQILTGRDYCEVELSWTTKNVATASLWQRTPAGLVSTLEGAKEASLKVAAYDDSTVYELREGKSQTGELLAAATTKGHRVTPSGELSLPDGQACALAKDQKTCSLRVSWTSNDTGRLWLREKALSVSQESGQVLVDIGASGGIVDLRAGTAPTGAILDRVTLSTIPVENSGKLSINGQVCEIPYSGSDCDQLIQYEINGTEGSVWSEDGQLLTQGGSGNLTVKATEYGKAYHLRAGSEVSNPILATYLAKGIKQTYRGSISPSTVDYCTFDYQGGECSVSVVYEASDKASIWDVGSATVVAGGQKSGNVNLVIKDQTGQAETTVDFDLKIHGNYSPKLNDPVLGSVTLRGIQPTHTGSVAATAGTSCNLLYSKNSCDIALRVITTSPSVTLWNNQTGQSVWYGGNGTSNFSIALPQGTVTYTLREGRKIENKAYGTVSLTGVRPSYFAQLTMPGGSNCNVTESNGTCALSFKLNSNTTTRVRYRDITTNPNAAWVVHANGLGANASFAFTASNVTTSRNYEFQVEQNASPYEPLDSVNATVTLNAPHSFELTSNLPQPGNGLQCHAPWSVTPSSRACISSIPVSWNTSATTVSVCRRKTSLDSYEICKSTTSKQDNFAQQWSFANTEYTIDFYEGNVAPSSRASAVSSSFRLLRSEIYVPGRMLSPEEMSFNVNMGSNKCEYTDVDDSDCSLSFTMSYAAPYNALTQNNSQTTPQFNVYLAKKGSVNVIHSIDPHDSTSATWFVWANRNDPTSFDYEVRLRAGASPSLSDPVVKSFTVVPVYRNVSGIVMGRRANYTIGSQYYYINGSVYPHYFSRSYNSVTGKYSESAEDCLLKLEDSMCTIYIYGEVNSGSRASVFVDGVYNSSLVSNAHLPTPVQLGAGLHEIAIYEGGGASAINNKKVDSFSVQVRRPSYTGGITPRDTDVQLSYYGETQAVALSFNMNTRAYIYHLETNSLVQSMSPNYGADEKFRISSAVTSPQLGAGTHTFELRTHADRSDPANIILATAQVNVAHKAQTMSIKPDPSFTPFYDTCKISFRYKTCIIYAQYINANSSSAGVVACIVSQAGIRKSALLNGVTAYTRVGLHVRLGDTELRFYNGKNCPSSIDNAEGYPLLAQHNIAPADYEIGAEIKFANYANIVTRDTIDSKKWYCELRYQGDGCLLSASVELIIPNLPGQNENAYYGVFEDNQSTLASSPNTYGNYSYTTSFTRNAGYEYRYDIYACNVSNYPGNCQKEISEHVYTATVQSVLPNYTATLTAPNGNGCMAAHGQNTCNIKLDYKTTSGNATIFRDGVSIETFTKNIPYSKSFSFPVKAKGVPTIITVVDGYNVNNRVLARLEIFPEVFDQSVFKFTDPITNGTLNKVCIRRYLTGESIDCELNIAYESDASDKYLLSSGVIDKSIVSGNGIIRASATPAINYQGFASGGSGGHYFWLYAYMDEAKTKLAGSLFVNYKNAMYSDNVLVANKDQFIENNPSYNSYWVGGSVGYAYYISSYGDSINLNQPMAIDDLLLTVPAGCSKTGSKNGSPDFCGLIDYKSIFTQSNPGQISGLNIYTSSSYTYKRLFYRASPRYAVSQADWSDPVVSVAGVTRPLNLDGNWHYVDINITGSNTISFSAINDASSGKTFALDIFAEYY